MATIELTKDNFEKTISENDTVLVDFWAPWCGPCKGFAPVFEAVSAKYPNAVFAKVNTDDEQELAGYFNIRSIPTLMAFREKIVVFQQAGALPASGLQQVVDKTLALDMKEVHEAVAKQQAEQAGNT